MRISATKETAEGSDTKPLRAQRMTVYHCPHCKAFLGLEGQQIAKQCACGAVISLHY